MGLILLYTMSQILHMLQRYIFADWFLDKNNFNSI